MDLFTWEIRVRVENCKKLLKNGEIHIFFPQCQLGQDIITTRPSHVAMTEWVGYCTWATRPLISTRWVIFEPRPSGFLLLNPFNFVSSYLGFPNSDCLDFFWYDLLFHLFHIYQSFLGFIGNWSCILLVLSKFISRLFFVRNFLYIKSSLKPTKPSKVSFSSIKQKFGLNKLIIARKISTYKQWIKLCNYSPKSQRREWNIFFLFLDCKLNVHPRSS